MPNCVVVGGSRGIGRAVALLLGELGTNVVVNGRHADVVDDTVGAITSSGGTAVGFVGAPDNERTATDLIDTCRTQYGGIDALINCAGIPEPTGSSILTITSGDFHRLIDAHLGTVFHTCRMVAPLMVQQRHGAIINTGSTASLGIYGGTGYPAGKAAVNGLTLAIAAELKRSGVRANVICPGARTRLSEGPEYTAHLHDLHTRGLLDDMTLQASLAPAPPACVAPLYAYLAGDLSARVTGQIFLAAGGFIGRFKRQTPVPLGYRDHALDAPWSMEEIDDLMGRR
ncbi:Putative short chain dehydrogenase/reductase [Mycobacteroides abscessus subsp. abscessus]|uniref:SDR family NAD(P)-dependent oxidoreductase n=1 Tax=Mycobacteroides abscessus TaxID=36809 RepID=UPI0009281470|nr:SDR family oxidoreductase [Mycobacteroides abscessus]MDM2347603.1 SDR family NAD(P)-dependent oxidoreductase [Mycobacteroides abscessus]MDM2357062.1 SDR family NAD(P)-dependent oxidoreductase [Mycobacteroides abscessus]QSN53437.1 SDR family oxidoreductase [Mycobacteroides abscessus subsp. abscessus]SIG87183.1 Putative short chain dehydrogenase/reductase [Mycobacteroides abscessus subsp. abscessus]SIH07930.1 Putative short chain dehydrogenase/reductase [Mycobacteroides abscessus subsp. absce